MNSPTWRQVVADVFDMPVKVLQQAEGAAFGAALQAAELLSDTTIDSLVMEHLVEDRNLGAIPDSSAVSSYNDAYEQYLAAVAAVTSLYPLSGATA